MDKDFESLRLQVYLARCGVGSRRKCEEYISDGRVTVNDKAVLVPGQKVGPEDRVCYNGRPVRPERENVYIALHKPSGFICSNQDDQGRPLAISLLSDVTNKRLYNVGRLDYMTSGLIFFTNDGEFSKLMTHPSSHLEKEYMVTTKKEIPKELMEQFKKGMSVQGEYFRLKRYTLKGSRSVSITLEEGKNKELRKVFLSKNITIKSIHRIRIGNIKLTGLASGHFRKLTKKEIDQLKNQAEENKLKSSKARNKK
ncbi:MULTISPECIES: pseudouridine synthase [unclassified Oceanispirochaeta]|uniref:pseudouridine synthase n=1 Tax=unclassified Oceanispirochaeta TaxID=2635722 RepID=UPI000E0908A1|nr:MULTISPECIES: pseudouridine synthase [unclassified Oceanispirochaeta]MBF9016077.1 rRNA pseudouridine synthase [Oceanispirochaeta sp. M2]NPD72540.1 rRNA pseudouridine synthase [Oceanispirochaeta sp. M1]RDG31997.1 rRNA pseudouridine synthase [Oceanispirochaeta sp. M1]